MPIPSEAEILARAKALCEQDGNVWDEQERRRMAARGYVPPFIDDEHRIAYLAQAKFELMKNHRRASELGRGGGPPRG
jgi:hypothetical protein